MNKKKVKERRAKGGNRIAGGWPVWRQQGDEILESIREHVLYYPDPWGTVALSQAILERGDARRIAFYDLLWIVERFLSQLVEWALEQELGELHELAGRALAHIGGSVRSRHNKLCAVNAAYLSEIKKIGREKQLGVILFPESKISRLVQRELFTALRMRSRLRVIKGIKNRFCDRELKKLKGFKAAFDEAKARFVAREYFPLTKLPPFSVKSFPQWWEFLWPLIGKKLPVSKMPALKVREYDTGSVSYNSRTGRKSRLAGGQKKREHYLSDMQMQ